MTGMGTICKWAIRIYLLLWAGATAIFVIGWLGLFDQPRDPLSGVFLMPLGLPWTLWTGALPEAVRPIAAILAPLANVAILILLCRSVRKGPAT